MTDTSLYLKMNDFQITLRVLEILIPHVQGTPQITAEHDQIWFHLGGDHEYNESSVGENDEGDQVTFDPSPLTLEEATELLAMNLFIDTEVGSWSMHV